MSRSMRVYQIWSGLVMFGMSTELLIWWRKGKRDCVNFAGGIFEFCNRVRKQFASLWELRFIYACFSKSEVEHKHFGKGLISAFFFLCVWLGVFLFVFFSFSFLLTYIDRFFLASRYILGRLSTRGICCFCSPSVEMRVQVIWFSQNPKVIYKETDILPWFFCFTSCLLHDVFFEVFLCCTGF